MKPPRLTEVFKISEARPHQPRFRVGQRVKLKAFPPSSGFPEGLPEEEGVVEEVADFKPRTGEQFYIVRVDAKYRDVEAHDDGYREVPDEQIEDPKGMN